MIPDSTSRSLLRKMGWRLELRSNLVQRLTTQTVKMKQTDFVVQTGWVIRSHSDWRWHSGWQMLMVKVTKKPVH